MTMQVSLYHLFNASLSSHRCYPFEHFGSSPIPVFGTFYYFMLCSGVDTYVVPSVTTLHCYCVICLIIIQVVSLYLWAVPIRYTHCVYYPVRHPFLILVPSLHYTFYHCMYISYGNLYPCS
jgi:hypothetical protein